jgi:hypothetical protein
MLEMLSACVPFPHSAEVRVDDFGTYSKLMARCQPEDVDATVRNLRLAARIIEMKDRAQGHPENQQTESR